MWPLRAEMQSSSEEMRPMLLYSLLGGHADLTVLHIGSPGSRRPWGLSLATAVLSRQCAMRSAWSRKQVKRDQLFECRLRGGTGPGGLEHLDTIALHDRHDQVRVQRLHVISVSVDVWHGSNSLAGSPSGPWGWLEVT